MKRMIWLMIVALALIEAPAMAEYYRYLDKQGNTLYTDDITLIPADQRSKVQSFYEQYPSSHQLDQPTSLPAAAVSQSPSTAAPDANRSLEADHQRMLEQKGALQTEYEALMAERQQIDAAREAIPRTSKTKRIKAIKQINQRADALNQKIAVYEKKVSAFNKEAERYDMAMTPAPIPQTKP